MTFFSSQFSSSSQSGLRLCQATLLSALLATAGAVQAAPSKDPNFDQRTFALQHALTSAGFELGRVDGIMDAKTEQALKAYQEANPAVPVTGKVDDATLRALGIKRGQTGQTASAAQGETQLAAGGKTSPESDATTSRSAAPSDSKKQEGWWPF